MLSMAATAPVQAEGGENGTDQALASENADEHPWKTYWYTIGPLILAAMIAWIVEHFFNGISRAMNFCLAKIRKNKDTTLSQQPKLADQIHIASGEGARGAGRDYHETKVILPPEALELLRPKPAEPPGKISNIPHPHNPNFTGRVDLLDRLSEALVAGERAAFTQTSAITGLGGVGKTQLALEYSYRHADDYRVVWWVRSEEPATLAADYAALARKLDLPEKEVQDQRVAVEAVRCWLEQNGGWLLVFDNAQEFKDLEDFLPRAGYGHVIITSRKQSWSGVARMLTVDMFTPAESVEFLRRRTGQDDEDAARALADALGDLPLALEQAGAYIQETGISLSAYLKLFQERRKELLNRGKPDAYPDTVATTWDLSFQKAKEEVPASADLLNLCAFLAPDDIPKSLLTVGDEHLPETLASAVKDEMALNDAIAALKRYSLMTVADDSLSVHRLVQAVARDRLSYEMRKRWAEAAVRLVNDAFPYDSDDVRTWVVCSALLPHALAAAGHSEEIEVAHEATCRLLNQAGLYLGGRAEFSEAKSAYERALEIGEKVYGPDHPNVATMVNNLGLVLRALGDLAGAKNSFERALEIGEKVYGPDHPNVATMVNNLGLVLRALGDLAGAKNSFERALEIGEKVYGPDHPNVATMVNNLGLVLRALGDLAGAKNSFERALEIDEKVYEPDHPNVATDVNNLGMVLQDLGDLAGARKSFERALEIDEKVYGPDHPSLARDVNNLGGVLRALGDLAGSKKSYERALEICRSRLGEDHPKTQLVKKSLELLKR